MAAVDFTFSIDLATAPRVHHHVAHEHMPGTSSWRIDTNTFYFHGTVDELRAFGHALIEAADARMATLAYVGDK